MHIKLHDEYGTSNFPVCKPATSKGGNRKLYAYLLLKNNAFHLLVGRCGARSTLIRIMFLHSSLHGEKQRGIQGNSLQS